MKGLLARHALRVKTGELAQGYASSHALAQFAEIRVLENLNGAEPSPLAARCLRSSAEIALFRHSSTKLHTLVPQGCCGFRNRNY